MNVSEIKAGDKIYFQGDQGKVMKVTHDGNEPLLEVALTSTRVTYLNPSQLDLYPLSEQLNENQKIKTNKNLLKINDLAFELQHGTVLTNEQWEKVEKIYKLSLMGDEEEE